ncbi:hypothetical protein HED60_23530 [Planctomycetales bacterium ZRK34]|nr:hypothetical protein HED60_23530 [Planctomycetales bacterium ZRK34]
MRTTRIELEADAGSLAIERKTGSDTIRIDSILRDPKRGEQAWKTWELPARISDEDLFKVATEVQRRTDGHRGTNSMIHDYYREMQRFQA